jgi:hypothetical protein
MRENKNKILLSGLCMAKKKRHKMEEKWKIYSGKNMLRRPLQIFALYLVEIRFNFLKDTSVK